MEPVSMAITAKAATAAGGAIQSAGKAASGVATIAKAVSGGSSHGDQPIGHGQGSRLAKILRGGSRGLKINRETAGIREVMASFFKHFGTDLEACQAIGFNAVADSRQNWLSTLLKGQTYIVSVNIDFLSEHDTHHTCEDLKVYMVFRHFLMKKQKKKAQIDNHADLIIALIPRLFTHFAQIPPTADLTRRGYKEQGLEKLQTLLEDCSDITYSQSSVFASDINELSEALDSTSWHVSDAARHLDTTPHITDYAAELAENLAMLHTWNVRILLSCLATKELPPDLAAKIFDLTAPEIIPLLFTDVPDSIQDDDLDSAFTALHKQYHLHGEIEKATLLSQLKSARGVTKPRLYRQFIEAIQLPYLITACLDRFGELGTEETDRHTTLGLYRKQRKVSASERCSIAKSKATTLKTLQALMRRLEQSSMLDIHSELRKNHTTRLASLFKLSLTLNTRLAILTYSCRKFFNLCISHGDTTARIEGIAGFLAIIEQLCSDINELNTELSELYNEQMRKKKEPGSSSLYYLPLASNDCNRKWIREIISGRGLQAHTKKVSRIILEISAILPPSSMQPNSWAQKEWMLSVCVIKRDFDLLDQLISKHSKAALPADVAALLANTHFLNRLRRASSAPLAGTGGNLSSTGSPAGAEPPSEGEGEGEGEEEDEESTEETQTQEQPSTEERADTRACARQAGETYREDQILSEFHRERASQAQQMRDRKNTIGMISKLESALFDYSLWRDTECSYGGRNLTGTHHRNHLEQARDFVSQQREQLHDETASNRTIVQVQQSCQAFQSLPRQGFFPRPTEQRLEHCFEAYLRPVVEYATQFTAGSS